MLSNRLVGKKSMAAPIAFAFPPPLPVPHSGEQRSPGARESALLDRQWLVLGRAASPLDELTSEVFFSGQCVVRPATQGQVV